MVVFFDTVFFLVEVVFFFSVEDTEEASTLLAVFFTVFLVADTFFVTLGSLSDELDFFFDVAIILIFSK